MIWGQIAMGLINLGQAIVQARRERHAQEAAAKARAAAAKGPCPPKARPLPPPKRKP